MMSKTKCYGKVRSCCEDRNGGLVLNHCDCGKAPLADDDDNSDDDDDDESRASHT